MLLLISEAAILLAYHPFYLSYYGELIGGLRGAVRRGFEATYWGEAYLAAVPVLNRRAPFGASVYICPPGVISLMRMYQGAGLLRRDLRWSGDEREAPQADLTVFHHRPSEWNRWAWHLFRTARPLEAPGISGVPLVFIYALPHAVDATFPSTRNPSDFSS
jgi:hypothetical protein